MANVTIGTPNADVATAASGIAAGLGPHLPIGGYGGQTYRSAIRFTAPAGWDSWTAITNAELSFYISDHAHVAVRNSTIHVRRQSTSQLWTKGEGSQNCNSGFSGSNTTQYSDLDTVTTDYRAFASGTTANAKKTVSCTGIVDYYWSNSTAYIVFVFVGGDSNEYSELWAEGYGYNAKLSIDYEVEAVPLAPTLILPTASQIVVPTKPTFQWDHQPTQDDPQLSADVQLYDAGGAVISTQPVAGAGESLVWPTDLVRGTAYQYSVRTTDVTGPGPYATKRPFSIKANPVVTVNATREMEFANGAPRLRVRWTHVGDPQTEYRVQTTSPTSDSLWQPGTTETMLLDLVNLTNGTPTTVTVSVRTNTGVLLEGSASRAFTPRWGLTTHRKDLTSIAPAAWGTPSWTPATQPVGASLVPEYASSPTASATPSPNVWSTSLSAVQVQNFLWYRVWFIPNATTSPTLDRFVIPSDSGVALVDKWGTVRGLTGLSPPWNVAGGEYVYGTRSAHVKLTDTLETKAYAYAAQVREGRSYVLTGLMKSELNSGARIQLEDASTPGVVLTGGGILTPPDSPIQTDELTTTKDWFTEDANDVYRYKTPIFVAKFSGPVHVVLRAQGDVGAQAWFDGIKLEESTVATPWSPAAIGATVLDAGGVQIDRTKEGVFRYKAGTGSTQVVTGGTQGLKFGDVEVYQPATGKVQASGGIIVPGAEVNGALTIGGDTRFDRTAANLLRLQAGDTLEVDALAGLSTWTNYTPTLYNFPATTINHAWYQRLGGIVFLSIRLTTTAAGGSASPIGISLPFNAGTEIQTIPFGHISGSAGNGPGTALINGAGAAPDRLDRLVSVSAASLIGTNLANGSQIRVQGWYRVA